MSDIFNTWLPGGKYYVYPSTDAGITSPTARTAAVELTVGGATRVVQTIGIDDSHSGWGTTDDMTFPAITINQPPIIAYNSDVHLALLLRDSDGWMWKAEMRAQPFVDGALVSSYERGWAWSRFVVAPASVAPAGYRVQTITVNSGGRGYVDPPVVDVAIPVGSGTLVKAHAVAVLTGDVVTSLSIIGHGCGFGSTPPVVTIDPPPLSSTTRATATATANMAVVSGIPPTSPGTGPINIFQIQLADGVAGPANVVLYYITGRSPTTLNVGDIQTFSMTVKDPRAYILNVGDVVLTGGERQPIVYNGSLPFGFMQGGPSRYRQSSAPYRGPYIAGYQDGTPWVQINTTTSQTALGNMLDFMLESQNQFRQKRVNANTANPSLGLANIIGPFMHCYLPATWDSMQTGAVDSWVFDAPDGNPAWDGWQYRAFDGMCKTWYAAATTTGISSGNLTKLNTICTRFLGWLYGWLQDNPTIQGVPNSWGPPGWAMGVPLPADTGYLDPSYAFQDCHDLALTLKGAVHCALSGANVTVCRYVIKRCITALVTMQYKHATDPMSGAFTLSPSTYDVYGFQQGEVMDALALALQHPTLVEIDTSVVSLPI